MSQANVDIVRRAWEAATSKPPNWSVLDALYHPDHVLASDWGGVNNTVYRGAKGFQESLLDQDDAWDEWRQELREVIDTSGDSVVVEARLVARGSTARFPSTSPLASSSLSTKAGLRVPVRS
jgi:hypothetical protein